MRDTRLDDRPTPEHELMLIRAGHYLWRQRKFNMWNAKALDDALQSIWDAKESVRVQLRAEWLAFSEKRAENLAMARQSRLQEGA